MHLLVNMVMALLHCLPAKHEIITISVFGALTYILFP